MQKKENSKPPMNKNERKRGRPAGKNRVPLSLVERRARNAQYERERRNETADAMAQLAEAMRCDPQITNPDLLATVINRIQNRQSETSIEDLKRINEDLESQIAALEKRLEEGSYAENDDENHSEANTTSQSDSETDGSIYDRRPKKFRKTAKRGKVHDGFRRSSSHHDTSTDSRDSNWSNHHMGKTLPPQDFLEETQPFDYDRTSSSHHEKADSSKCQVVTNKEEFYSQCSNQSGEFYEENKKDVKVEFQLLSEISQIRSDSTVDKQTADPFTDREKAILAKLGWSDSIDFQGVYSENQSRWPPMDYAGF